MCTVCAHSAHRTDRYVHSSAQSVHSRYTDYAQSVHRLCTAGLPGNPAITSCQEWRWLPPLESQPHIIPSLRRGNYQSVLRLAFSGALTLWFVADYRQWHATNGCAEIGVVLVWIKRVRHGHFFCLNFCSQCFISAHVGASYTTLASLSLNHSYIFSCYHPYKVLQTCQKIFNELVTPGLGYTYNSVFKPTYGCTRHKYRQY